MQSSRPSSKAARPARTQRTRFALQRTQSNRRDSTALCASDGNSTLSPRSPELCRGLLVFDAVGYQHAAVRKRTALLQLQIDLPAHGMKRRNAGAEEHRVDVEADLVDESGLEQRLGELASTHQTDFLAVPLFQPANEFHRAVADD